MTPVTANESRFSHANVTTFLRVAAVLVALFVGLKIMRYGFLPNGDARRHVAQAISGKDYHEVLALRPEYVIDHSPGWDALLRQVHLRTGMGEDALITLSVVAMLFLLLCAPLPWLRCPEAWLAAVLVFHIALSWFALRVTQGRPFLLTEAILLMLLASWRSVESRGWPRLLLTAAGFTLSAWIHGTWYLWPLLPLAFLVAGQWRNALALFLCWIAGTLVGASLTGNPIAFLKQGIELASVIAHEHLPANQLVPEFQPGGGELGAVLLLAGIFIWRGPARGDVLRSPLFWLVAGCWILGLSNVRFWLDWGAPAAILWAALQLQEIVLTAWQNFPARRLAFGGFLAISLYLSLGGDVSARYTNTLQESFFDAENPQLKGWLPDPGGTFYNDDMFFFFNTYYKNPQAPWRYMIGFEPAWMPAEDVQIYRHIQATVPDTEAYLPWVKKMRLEDRMEIYGARQQPDLPPLEWLHVGNYWLGRIPRHSIR